MVKNIYEPITDIAVLSSRVLEREGFPFSSLTNPANVYDAIVIKIPPNAQSYSPVFPLFHRSLHEYVSFINEHQIEKAIIIAENIEFVKRCPSLSHLQIIPANSVGNGFDFSPLYDLPNLKSLTCNTSYGEQFKYSSAVDYERIKGVQSLHIAGRGHLNFNKISTLKSLSVFENKFSDLSEIFTAKSLDSLKIVQCSVKNLNGIEQSSKMQCLYLWNNKDLFDINALEAVQKSLKVLSILNCPKISDFSVLNKLENLEQLTLYGKNTLPNLSFLKKMKNLRSFGFDMEILDGDLSFCLHLENAYCAKGKRHYNLKNKDLPKKRLGTEIGTNGIDIWRRVD